MLIAIVLVPALAGLLAFALPSERPQRWLLLLTAVAHAALVAASVISPSPPALDGWLHADALGLLFLGITSALFLLAALYGVGYLQREVTAPRPDFVEGVLFSNQPQRIFVGCMLLFLAAMSLVTVSQHMGLLWVGIEATTLASAPLIYFHRHHRSLEATWKYLLLCSVGIAVALLGTLFLAMAASNTRGEGAPLLVGDLVAGASSLHPVWLKAAFVLLLVGYGTKMGLAPFHSWLPDAHSESPSLVSALMSGALLNCAFLGLLRAYQVVAAAGEGAFARELLIAFGLISLAVAAVFVIGQTDYKRMLAYSSVEHMGILALGVGVGGAATFGAMLHAVNHSLTKGLLFLVAGNILTAYRTTSVRGVRGLLHALPVSGPLWTIGFLAIVGMPPFGLFLSEFIILQAIFVQGHPLVAAAFLALLAVAFIGMATIVLRMALGEPWAHPVIKHREPLLSVLPPAALAVAVLLTGLYLPPALQDALQSAAGLLGGGR
ncbi:MAG: proton-conducting transporter membrane subunit [Dehalococcoidia bacterium]|nr:proton-conducting transporter membrane subunit [Dehalococcoidia bacterium]